MEGLHSFTAEKWVFFVEGRVAGEKATFFMGSPLRFEAVAYLSRLCAF
jgi:hypothetical protein